jgi:uncharacterized membrane protein YccC
VTLRGVNWKQGIKTTLAAAICLVLARIFRLHQGYWACISAIVIVQSKMMDTWSIARDRIVGTAMGALLGWGAVIFWHGSPLIYAATVLLCMTLPPLAGFRNGARFAGVAASIVMLVPSDLPHWKVATGRFFEVSLGSLVALAVSQAVWRNAPSD